MNHLIGKTVKTRGGFDVEIIAVRPELKRPIIGIFEGASVDDGPTLEEWYIDGRYCEHKNQLLDLVLE